MNILVNQANTSHAGQVAAEEKMASLEREAEEALASYQSRKRELDHELQAGQKMLQKSLEMIAKVTAIAHSHSQFQRALVDNMNHRGQSKGIFFFLPHILFPSFNAASMIVIFAIASLIINRFI